MSTPLRVLISMTEKDLGSHGADAARLIRRGCQRRADVRIMHEFGYYDGVISQKLRREVRECDVIIHIVGMRYGSSPKTEQYISKAGYACSYTQLEYWLAKDYKKKVFVILCSDDFPYDPVKQSEGIREKGIQDYHRRYFENQDHETYRVESVHLLQSTIHFISQTLLQGIADKWEKKYINLKLFSLSIVVMFTLVFVAFRALPSLNNYDVVTIEPVKTTINAAPSNEENITALSNPNGLIGSPKLQNNVPDGKCD